MSQLAEGTLRLGVDVRPGLLELARAILALSWKRAPVRFLAASVFGLAWVGVAGASLVDEVLRGVQDGASMVSLVVSVFAGSMVLPFSRALVFASIQGMFARRSRTTIVDVSSTHLGVRSEVGESHVPFSSFDRRLDHGAFLALGSPGNPIPLVIPRRAFVDVGGYERIRAAMLAPPDAIVAASVAAFAGEADPNALRYQLTPDESIRGARLVTARTISGAFAPLLFVVVTLAVVREIVRAPESWAYVLAMAAIFALFLGLARLRARRELAARLVPVTLRFDDARVWSSTTNGTVESTWADARGRREDERVFVIVLPGTAGIVVPKRALPDDVAAFFREKLAPI